MQGKFAGLDTVDVQVVGGDGVLQLPNSNIRTRLSDATFEHFHSISIGRLSLSVSQTGPPIAFRITGEPMTRTLTMSEGDFGRRRSPSELVRAGASKLVQVSFAKVDMYTV